MLSSSNAKKGDLADNVASERRQALSCTDQRVIAVSRRRLLVNPGGRQRAVTLSALLEGPIVRTAPVDTGTTLLLGLAMGEWGGSLKRIDTVTSAVSEVPGLGEPINGVAPDLAIRAASSSPSASFICSRVGR